MIYSCKSKTEIYVSDWIHHLILRVEKLSVLYVNFCHYRYFTNAETFFESFFDEILKESAPGPESTSTNVRVEVQTYFSEPTIPLSDSPLLYWRINQSRLPSLAITATTYLCAPSASVESERLFSTASIITNERRSRLTAEKAEMLIFLKKNLPLMMK